MKTRTCYVYVFIGQRLSNINSLQKWTEGRRVHRKSRSGWPCRIYAGAHPTAWWAINWNRPRSLPETEQTLMSLVNQWDFVCRSVLVSICSFFFSLLKVPIRMIVKFSSCSVYLNFVPAKKKNLENFHPLPHPLGASVQLVQGWLVFSTISTRHAILITDNNSCIYFVTKISFLH